MDMIEDNFTEKPGCFGFATTYGADAICDDCNFNNLCAMSAKENMKKVKEVVGIRAIELVHEAGAARYKAKQS